MVKALNLVTGRRKSFRESILVRCSCQSSLFFSSSPSFLIVLSDIKWQALVFLLYLSPQLPLIHYCSCSWYRRRREHHHQESQSVTHGSISCHRWEIRAKTLSLFSWETGIGCEDDSFLLLPVFSVSLSLVSSPDPSLISFMPYSSCLLASASNGVPPSVSKRILLNVHCKDLCVLFWCLFALEDCMNVTFTDPFCLSCLSCSFHSCLFPSFCCHFSPSHDMGSQSIDRSRNHGRGDPYM